MTTIAELKQKWRARLNAAYSEARDKSELSKLEYALLDEFGHDLDSLATQGVPDKDAEKYRKLLDLCDAGDLYVQGRVDDGNGESWESIGDCDDIDDYLLAAIEGTTP